MAHQIDFTTGQAAIAYATDTDVPWHGLGQTVDPEASVEVWQKAAQLEWRALKAEVQFDSTVTNQRESFADKHVLYRSDCGAPLSVVSSDYQVSSRRTFSTSSVRWPRPSSSASRPSAL
nr:hypothetical protein [Candidatus Accumulibacter sp. ACC012]